MSQLRPRIRRRLVVSALLVASCASAGADRETASDVHFIVAPGSVTGVVRRPVHGHALRWVVEEDPLAAAAPEPMWWCDRRFVPHRTAAGERVEGWTLHHTRIRAVPATDAGPAHVVLAPDVDADARRVRLVLYVETGGHRVVGEYDWFEFRRCDDALGQLATFDVGDARLVSRERMRDGR